MCGIAGIAHANDQPADQVMVVAMTRALAHRGPDGEGYHFAPGVGLGHRRLAILDLSPAGKQPMSNEDGTVWVTYNGEIYDHLDVRRRLERNGHHFRSRTDTEVLVHLWEEHGESLVDHIHGMFAFALWDARRRCLFLARDRIGIKPLFVHERPGELRFASEVPPLLLDPTVSRDVDAGALDDYLAQGYAAAPRTLLAAIRQLEPGETWTFGPEGRRARSYWDFRPRPAEDSRWAERLESTLRGAVRSHLMSDVPYGALLSSGLDSTTLVGVLVGEHDAASHTFTADFAEGDFSEGERAAASAAALGAGNRQVTFRAPDVDLLRTIVRHAAEPTADVSMLPFYAVCGLARRHVKVALSGEGADELFAGYETYTASLLAAPAARVPRWARRAVRRALAWLPASDARTPRREKADRFLAGLEHEGRDCHMAWRQICDPLARAALLPGAAVDRARPPGAAALDRAAALGRLDAFLYADLRHYLPSDMLVKADRMSMAHGLEIRVPYLADEMVALAEEIPASLKLRRLVERKWILRQVAERVLPPSIVPPRRKLGFNVPLAAWLRGPLRELVGDILDPTRVARQGLLRPEAVRSLRDQHLTGRRNCGYELYALLMLGIWVDEVLRAPAAAFSAEPRASAPAP